MNEIIERKPGRLKLVYDKMKRKIVTEERLMVLQHGKLVGTLPRPNCNTSEVITYLIKSEQNLGDPLATLRREDFRTEWCVTDNGWRQKIVLIANPMLGLGDLENIRGFEAVS